MTPSNRIPGAGTDPRGLAEQALSAARAAPGVFWELAGERARQDAESASRRLRQSAALGGLDGLPVATKDAFAVAGLPQHLGLTRARVSAEDAVAVAKLREAGAIVIGTTAMDQLGWTMSGQAPGYPRCENPVAPDRSPGGSSGGAAAAVAAGIVPLALGADSAGSVRVPAAWCGAVGFKPTFGAIDLEGCAPLAPVFDTAGLIARHVDECRLAFCALTGTPPEPAVPSDGPRVGIPAGFIASVECDPKITSAWQGALEGLVDGGLALREVGAVPAVRGIGALFAANLAVRWGDVVDAEPPELVHPDVRAGVDYGRSLTVGDYLHAGDALSAARRRAMSLFDGVDLLALPTAPILPPPLEDPAPVSVASAFARPWSAFGWPALTMPCRAGESDGCGIQLVARPGDDIRLLDWASRLQAAVAGADRRASRSSDTVTSPPERT